MRGGMKRFATEDTESTEEENIIEFLSFFLLCALRVLCGKLLP
jgi:hypothetical protein